MSKGGKRIGAGRPVGTKSPVTLKVEAAKAELIAMYMENIRPINQALIDKALKGDILAIKELHDRVYGKSAQPITGGDGGPIKVEHITGMKIQKE